MAALRRAPSAAAMVGALALLVVAWTMAVPLGSGQDETDHYVRAVAAGHLTLTGRSAHVPAPAAKQASRAAQPSAFEWAIANTRWFHVPNGLAATPQCGFMYLNAKAPIRCHSSRP